MGLAAEKILKLAAPAGRGGALIPTGHGTGGRSAPLASIAGGAYEGADRFDRQLARWAPPMRSADGDLLADKIMADVRGRDQSRNDAFVANAIRLHQDSIVGARYMLIAKPNIRVLGLDDTWAQEFSEEVEAKFMTWAESDDNWIDSSRRVGFTDMVRLAVGVDSMGGEALASVEWVRDGDQRRVWNTAINFLDTDRLSNPNNTFDTTLLRAGIARDKFGAPQGYWVRRAHPGDFWSFGENWIWDYVPASKPWGRPLMIHIYETQRPDQSRGVAMMVSALKEMRMTRKFRDIVLQNAVIGASYAATIESELPTEAVYQALGQGAAPDLQASIQSYGNAYLRAVMNYAGHSSDTFMFDGAKIPHLYPGTKLQVRPAGSPGGVGQSFEDSMLRYISASLGVGYEEFSKNYSNTNYSSIKAGMATIRRGSVARKRRTADRFSNIVYRLWLEESLAKGLIESMPRNAPSLYDGINLEAYTDCDWIGASTGQIDELHETQAANLRIANGLSTFQTECARLGLDWRDVMRQKAREKATMQKLDIWDDYVAAALPAAVGAANALGADKPGQGKQPDDPNIPQKGPTNAQ